MGSEAIIGPQRLVDMRTVFDASVEAAVTGLHDLAASMPRQSDAERKRALLQHLHATRQRLLRLHVVVVWGQKASAMASLSRVLDVSQQHSVTLQEAADHLAHLHAELQPLLAPIYDVPSAAEVLECGSYPLLPACIEELRPAPPPGPAERASALRLMDQHLRTQLLMEALVSGMRVGAIGAGKAVLHLASAYEATVTLVPEPGPELVLARYSASVSQQQQSASEQPSVQAGAPGKGGAVKEEPSQSVLANGSVKEEAAEPMDVGGAGAGAEAAAVAELPQWRWRLLSFHMLPDFVGRALLAPEQVAALQAAIEERMWAAADGVALRHMGDPAAAAAGAAAPAGPGQSVHSTGRLSGLGVGLTPLGLMHGILRDTAARLLCGEAIVNARAACAHGARWDGQLVISPARTLAKGMRLTFWPKISIVSRRDVESPHTAPALGSVEAISGLPPTSVLGVSLEVGLDSEQRVVVLPEGNLADAAAASGTQLMLDAATADVDTLLMQAAAIIARQQLGALQKMLQSLPHFPKALGGSAVIRDDVEAPPGGGSTSRLQPGGGLVAAPVLDALHNGSPVLSAIVDPCTGRLRFTVSGDISSSTLGGYGPHLLQAESFAAKAQAQAAERVAELAALATSSIAVAPPAPGRPQPPSPAMQFVKVVADSLQRLFYGATRRAYAHRLTECGRRLSLQTGSIHSSLLREYVTSHPGIRGLPANRIVLAFSPVPPLAGFPAAPRCSSPHSMQSYLLAGREADDLAAAEKGATYQLAIVRCNAHGQPFQVLKLVSVPESVAAGSSSANIAAKLPPPTASRISQPKQRTKRKRDGGEGAQAAQTEGEKSEGSSSSGQSPAAIKANDGGAAARAAGEAAELGAVVGWCRQRIVLSVLQLQLKELKLSWTEVGYWQAGSSPSRAALRGSATAADAGRRRYRRCLRLGSLSQLAALDGAALSARAAASLGTPADAADGESDPESPAAAAGRGSLYSSSFELEDMEGGSVDWVAAALGQSRAGGGRAAARWRGGGDGGEDGKRWMATLRSPYLATQPPGKDFLRPLMRDSDGVSIVYSLTAGDTALTAVSDMASILQLHTFLSRCRQQTAGRGQHTGNESGGGEPHSTGASEAQESAHLPREELLWHMPGSGSVSVGELTLHDASLVVTAALTTAAGAVQLDAVPPLRLGIQWLPAEAEEGGVETLWPRCLLSSEQALPPGFVTALQSMAEGSEARFWPSAHRQFEVQGEMLDALVVAGPSAAAAAGALAPLQLRKLGADPSLVSWMELGTPYRLRLLLRKSGGPWLSVDLRFHAGQLTWVRLSSSPPPEAAPPVLPNTAPASAHTSTGVQPQLAVLLLDLIARLPGVHLPPAAVSNGKVPRGGMDGGGAAAGGTHRPDALGVWVQAGALSAALTMLITHLVKLS